MPFWLVKLSVSPVMKPDETSTDALARLPLLSWSLKVSVLSSVTGVPPPSKITVEPAVTVGGTWFISMRLVSPPLPLLVLPSLTTQLMRRKSKPLELGSPFVGLKL